MPPSPIPPATQRRLGLALITTGKQEILASKNLDSAATSLEKIAPLMRPRGRIDKSMSSLEAGTRSTRDLLTPVASALHFVANKLNQIKVPRLNTTTRRMNIPIVGRVRVVTAVSVSKTRPFRDAGIVGKVSDIADDIDNIATALKTIADGIRDIHKDLPAMRANVVNGSKSAKAAATNLNASGKQMVAAGNSLLPKP